MQVPLGRVIAGAKADAILGIADRDVIIDFVDRAVELVSDKSNYNVWLGEMTICSDACGVVTLPSIVGTVLQVNVCGRPTVFRSDWFYFHINGPGDNCGPMCGFSDDQGWSPVYQDLNEWSVVAAICEDAIDGNGTKELIVEGETKDCEQNPKNAITIPVTGPSSSGVRVKLMTGQASTDPAVTCFRTISRVTKPVTRGYVKLIAFPMRQFALAVNVGYYAPNETNPRFRRIRVGAKCAWVRVKYRRASLKLVDDHDIVPIGSYQATLDLLKSIRLSDSNNIDASEAYLAKAVRLLNEIQSRESGTTYTPIQVEPGYGVGTIDYR